MAHNNLCPRKLKQTNKQMRAKKMADAPRVVCAICLGGNCNPIREKSEPIVIQNSTGPAHVALGSANSDRQGRGRHGREAAPKGKEGEGRRSSVATQEEQLEFLPAHGDNSTGAQL